ncbi:MAG: Crp/Fnr family transcriptional regulator [Deltaproteobacteria bacterium]|nr:Crp/Fnr family transcriptional regulator [Deltaproteobacteria bacterium]MBW2662087.1 Crp/Fnr family transcriptional regulator [Deltaproteobacteria bacterium]
MTVNINLIESLDVFADLKYAEMELIASLMHKTRVTEGEVIARRGDFAHTCFIVLSGNFMISFKGGSAITLHNKGDIMGCSAVVAPFNYAGTATALTNGEVLSMPGQDFLSLIQSNSALSDKIMKKINRIVTERAPFLTGGV